MTNRTATPSPMTPPGGIARHRDHILDELRHDPYQAKRKYPEPTRCPDCDLVFRRGRWQRGVAPPHAHADRCPACRRMADKLPAGFVTLSGPFAQAHRPEITALVRHEAEAESSEHPLHRIMSIDEGADVIEVTTTDLHLPRRIGAALEHAYDGTLEIHRGRDEFMVRVRWSR